MLNYYTSHVMVTKSETEDAGVYTCTAEVSGEKLEQQIKIDLYRTIFFNCFRLNLNFCHR